MESKKLRAYYAAVIGLIGLGVVGSLMIWLIHTPWEFLSFLGGQIIAALGFHNGAQAMADRSPNYNPPDPNRPKAP